MKAPTILATALACSALVPISARVDPQAAAQATAGRATFRTTTELVALNVTVVDSHERDITGLTSGDFAVYDDGVPQRLDPISIASSNPVGNPRADPEDRTLDPIDDDLRRLAKESGGQAFFPQRLDELDRIYTRVANELSTQYSLAYVPRGPARGGVFHRLLVQVVSRGDAFPRTRLGYVAEQPDHR